MFKKNTLHFVLLAVVLVAVAQLAYSRPSKSLSIKADDIIDPSEYHGNLSEETIRKIMICDRDTDTMELCMRCAKVTKVEYLYPMCCANEENVRDWCADYIYYGHQ